MGPRGTHPACISSAAFDIMGLAGTPLRNVGIGGRQLGHGCTIIAGTGPVSGRSVSPDEPRLGPWESVQNPASMHGLEYTGHRMDCEWMIAQSP